MNLATITTAAKKKIILITGATDGLGLETAKALVELGHHVLLHGRKEAKLQAVAANLIQSYCTSTEPNDSSTSTTSSTTTTTATTAVVETYRADFSKLSEVNAMAEQILAKHSKLDVLINNAGVLKPKSGNTRTVNMLDVRFAVNTFAPYLLTRRLMPCLKAAAAGAAAAVTATTTNGDDNNSTTNTNNAAAMVINITTAIQKIVDEVAMRGRREASMGDMDAYAQSKLALIMWNNAMAEKYANDNICFLALNPGSMLNTRMVKKGYFGGTITEGNPVSIGRDIIVKAALTFGMADSGKYFDNDRGTFGTPYYDAADTDRCQYIVRNMEASLQNIGFPVADD